MAGRKRYDAFVSYSHKDAAIVKPLVQVLSVAKRRVFWDEIIQPGREWNSEIEMALAASDTIVIMWCCDSAASRWVAREIAAARKLLKPLTPIRLCAYPLRAEVANFQAIDFSKDLYHACDCASNQEKAREETKERLREILKQRDLDPSQLEFGFRLSVDPSGRQARRWLRWTIFGLGAFGLGAVGYSVFENWPGALFALLAEMVLSALMLGAIYLLLHFGLPRFQKAREARELKKRERIAETIDLIKHALSSQGRAD